ncbi:MAG: Glu-tRNA(Gln) amidotransferase subunit GatD [Candidatus Bathyarchaeia archaeon]
MGVASITYLSVRAYCRRKLEPGGMSEQFGGYRGRVRQILAEAGVGIEDSVKVVRDSETYEGVLVPRSEYGDEEHIVLKLKSGYNIGLRVTSSTRVERLGPGPHLAFTPPEPPQASVGLPRVAIISTGGTIASRVDYRTGAVKPALSAMDLYRVVPELSSVASIEAEILFSILSENMTPRHWEALARAVAARIEEGVDGVVVAHGTDTMGYTAAALSFALQDLPVPVVLVGSQRSSDRPSSDAAVNLLGAVKAASEAPFAEVMVAMHGGISDTAVHLHRGVKVRKCHTSRRDAFKSVNAEPLAVIEEGRLIVRANDLRPRDEARRLRLEPSFEEKVALLKSYPGLNSGVVEALLSAGLKGLILEGTGLGHVPTGCIDALRRAARDGLFVGMTSQCLWGRVDMFVYDTGRDLIAAGVTPLEDMLPETALVKLMWVLGQTESPDRARKLMLTNIAGEISPRTSYRWVAPE